MLTFTLERDVSEPQRERDILSGLARGRLRPGLLLPVRAVPTRGLEALATGPACGCAVQPLPERSEHDTGDHGRPCPAGLPLPEGAYFCVERVLDGLPRNRTRDKV